MNINQNKIRQTPSIEKREPKALFSIDKTTC